jgi:hypothetical protein
MTGSVCGLSASVSAAFRFAMLDTAHTGICYIWPSPTANRQAPMLRASISPVCSGGLSWPNNSSPHEILRPVALAAIPLWLL